MNTAVRLLRIAFWLAVLGALLGYVITFVPGAESGWYALVAVLALGGIFVPKRSYRIAAVLLFTVALVAVYEGHPPQRVFRVGQQAQPGRTVVLASSSAPVVLGQHSPDSVFIQFNTKALGQLFSDLGTAQMRISPLQFQDGLDQFGFRSFGAGFTSASDRRVEISELGPGEGPMTAEEG
jgi:hypothetical protein